MKFKILNYTNNNNNINNVNDNNINAAENKNLIYSMIFIYIYFCQKVKNMTRKRPNEFIFFYFK